jgi:VanZ family protein
VETPEERTHLIEYSLVAILIYQALVERKRNGRQVPFPTLLAFTATVILGLLDESIQWNLPNRVFDWVDVGFNTLAALMAIGVSLALVYVRRLKLPTLNK